MADFTGLHTKNVPIVVQIRPNSVSKNTNREGKEISRHWMQAHTYNGEMANGEPSPFANQTSTNLLNRPKISSKKNDKGEPYRSWDISLSEDDTEALMKAGTFVEREDGTLIGGVQADVQLPYPLKDRATGEPITRRDGRPFYTDTTIKNFAAPEFEVTENTLNEVFERSQKAREAAKEAGKETPAPEAQAETAQVETPAPAKKAAAKKAPAKKAAAKKPSEKASDKVAASATTEAQAEGPELG